MGSCLGLKSDKTLIDLPNDTANQQHHQLQQHQQLLLQQDLQHQQILQQQHSGQEQRKQPEAQQASNLQQNGQNLPSQSDDQKKALFNQMHYGYQQQNFDLLTIEQKNQLAQQYKAEGNKFYQVKQFLEAIAQYTKAIELDGKTAIYFTNRALCFRKLRNWFQAVQDCEKAIQLDSTNYKAYQFLGQSQVEIIKQSDLQDNEFIRKIEEAIQTLNKSYQLFKEQNNGAKDNLILFKQLKNNIYASNKIKWIKQRKIREKKTQQFQKLLDTLFLNEQDQSYKQLAIELAVEKFSNNENKKIPEHLCCKITFDIFEEPILYKSGLTYEREVVEQHFRKNGYKDPVTREYLDPKQNVFNSNIQFAIEDFKNTHYWHYQMEEEENIQKIIFDNQLV